MMTGIRNILWLLPLLLVVTWPLWGGPVEDFLTPPKHSDSAEQSTVPSPKNFSMDGVVFHQDKQGIKDWRIKTKRLYTEGGESRLKMEKVEAAVFREQQPRFHITSKSGLYDSKLQLLTLMDNVKVENGEGYEIRTPVLQYDDRNREIETDAPVQIDGKDIEITGKGLRYNMDSGAYEIGGRMQFRAW